jgi:hypothetical protein
VPMIFGFQLYVSNIKISDGITHQGVIFVCTMANNVYAFDVDTAARIWGPVALGPGRPIKPTSQHKKADPLQPQDSTDIDLYGINNLWGILSTPVIDGDTNTMYVVNWSSEDGTRPKARHFLHAVDITTGKDLRSIEIHATAPIDQAVINAAAVPASGTIETTSAVVPTRPKGGGGIWQAGQGPAADDQGNIYCVTANGGYIKFLKNNNVIDHTVDHNGTTDFAESFVRLKYTPPIDANAAGTFVLADWFIPFKDLVHRLAYNDDVVAFKMGRRQGARMACFMYLIGTIWEKLLLMPTSRIPEIIRLSKAFCRRRWQSVRSHLWWTCRCVWLGIARRDSGKGNQFSG